MMAGFCPSGCRVPRPNSKKEMYRKPKIGRLEAYKKVTRVTPQTCLEVNRQKVKSQGLQAD